jgi:hypothetical protein
VAVLWAAASMAVEDRAVTVAVAVTADEVGFGN